ncbi:SLC13 family permease [Salipiger sp. PrR002]|uniref:SLC13 family permease n=1 Tax=Salipiger sp. PrR002 TaxID=2706489 RepID=UPI0013B76DAF|nr:SLC13 family permease [Salipiger sp. PrR002]NDW00930.1 SLC13 family permease [Salipiger sp. PrR002]NDW56477.1 SLC13 family permease [Salipiger sp. PrR004]
MTLELAMVLGLLVLALVLFARGRPRMDAVALLVMVALPFTGVLSMSEALSGFSDSSVVLIAALFVIGEGLVRTGVAQWMGDQITTRAGGREGLLLVLLMLAAALLSAFMSSTGVVAIFVPIVLGIARRAGIGPGRLMMPLSMAALISGMLTLVATPPNMVIHAELLRRGLEGFSFFAFLPFGLPVLVLAMLYMLATGRFLAPDAPPPVSERRHMAEMIDSYGLRGRLSRLQITPGSDLIGHQLGELDLRGRDGVTILTIERPRRWGTEMLRPTRETVLQSSDILLLGVIGESFDLEGWRRDRKLQMRSLGAEDLTRPDREVGIAEAMVPPGSHLAGRSPAEARLRTRRELTVIGLRRGSGPLEGAGADTKLRAGDTLLLLGRWPALRRMSEDRSDLLPLDLPEEADAVAPEHRRAPLAVAVLLAVVLAMATGALPNAQAALLGCLAMGAFRIIGMDGAYRAINWQTLVLIAGMMPFATALERAGGVDLAAQAVLGLMGEMPPRAILSALFLATTLLSLFISNTATAVLMGPVAMAVADGLGASPYPFAMCVALAASTAFMTPVSSPVNLLVMVPGGYKFTDFLRIGAPFTLVTMAVCITLLPILLPL